MCMGVLYGCPKGNQGLEGFALGLSAGCDIKIQTALHVSGKPSTMLWGSHGTADRTTAFWARGSFSRFKTANFQLNGNALIHTPNNCPSVQPGKTEIYS